MRQSKLGAFSFKAPPKLDQAERKRLSSLKKYTRQQQNALIDAIETKFMHLDASNRLYVIQELIQMEKARIQKEAALGV